MNYAKLKNIKILTKRIMHSTLAGDYASAFKGAGLEFDQIREYHVGDDIRFLNWNSLAKTGKLMVKQFVQERDRTVILAIDLSGSLDVSSQEELKKEMMATVAASLSFIADANKDKVGALFFSDRIEKWIAPSRGKAHIGTILKAIFETKPSGTQTDFEQALKFLVQLKKRNSIVFMLSDWISTNDTYKKLLRVARGEYDFVGVRFIDKVEQELPDIGLLDVYDPETGELCTLDTGAKSDADVSLTHFLKQRLSNQRKLFEKYKIDLLDLIVGESFIPPMIKFFHERIRSQI